MLVKIRRKSLIVTNLILPLMLVFGVFAADSRRDGRSFDEEFRLAVLAGRDRLPESERQKLRAENHPLLAQIGDPNTAKLIRLFAQLSDNAHNELRAKGYLKWDFKQLANNRKQTLRELIQLNIDLATKQGGKPQPGFSIEALEKSQIGFSAVEIPETKQKVVSWFVLWPELPSPTWVTVVNARAAGNQPYFQAHLRQLPLLKSMKPSGGF